jgi:hypothetical protein
MEGIVKSANQDVGHYERNPMPLESAIALRRLAILRILSSFGPLGAPSKRNNEPDGRNRNCFSEPGTAKRRRK